MKIFRKGARSMAARARRGHCREPFCACLGCRWQQWRIRTFRPFPAGRVNALKGLMGAVMAKTHGRAEPRMAEALLRELLGQACPHEPD